MPINTEARNQVLKQFADSCWLLKSITETTIDLGEDGRIDDLEEAIAAFITLVGVMSAAEIIDSNKIQNIAESASKDIAKHNARRNN